MEHLGPSEKSNLGKISNSGHRDEQDAKKTKQPPRKRVSQACDRCRSRKDKCDGKRPACTTCLTHGRTCSYDANVKKRGLPEGYVRGMEKLWGLAIREMTEIEDHILQVVAGDDGSDTFLAVWNDETNSDSLVESWRKSQISRELERLLENRETPVETTKRKRTESDSQAGRKPGFASGYINGQEDEAGMSGSTWLDRKQDIRAQEQQSPNMSNIYDNSNQCLGGNYESILSPANHPTSLSNPSAPTPDTPDLPSEAWHLLDVYFSYTHSWLPIIEKHDLLRTSYQYSQNRSSIFMSGAGSGNHAALWAAIAYAKFQHRTINNIPHAQGAVAEMVWTAERMYTQARSLIPNEEGFFELGHVQALLILSLANLGLGHLNRAWLLIGQAVRIGLDLGLAQPQDDILAVLKSGSRTKHVFLGCFILDTIVAARLNHRPHLRAEDVERIGLVEEDGLEEWDPWADCLSVRRKNSASPGPASILSTFNRLVEVLQILNEAVCVFNSPKRLQSTTGLLEKLHTWSQSQSSTLYFDSAAIRSEKAMSLLPHQYNLHIAYFSTLATSQLLSRCQGTGIAGLEPSTRSIRQTVELLIQESNNFGLLIVPPTFEYFLKTAYDVVNEVNTSFENTHIILNDWKYNLDSCLDRMEPAWPIFESFKSSTSYQTPSSAGGRRESQVAYDLISGMNHSVETPPAAGTPNSLGSYDMMSPHMARPQTQINNTSQPGRATSSIPLLAQSFGQSSGRPLSMKGRTSPQSLSNNNNSSAGQWSTQNPAPQLNNPPSQQQNLHPHLRNSMNPEMELDPMFQEFATIDATEW
jgi:hypothetical protein